MTQHLPQRREKCNTHPGGRTDEGLMPQPTSPHAIPRPRRNAENGEMSLRQDGHGQLPTHKEWLR